MTKIVRNIEISLSLNWFYDIESANTRLLLATTISNALKGELISTLLSDGLVKQIKNRERILHSEVGLLDLIMRSFFWGYW